MLKINAQSFKVFFFLAKTDFTLKDHFIYNILELLGKDRKKNRMKLLLSGTEL